jgi:single-stranded DNA-binding protein
VLAHFRKGVRVWVTGDLHLHRYKDRETGEPRAALRMTADNVALLPYRIERIAFTARRGAADDGEAADQADNQPGSAES